MKLSYLVRGFPGHPAHPPLTDAAIGAYTFGTIAAFLDVLGIAEENGAKAWWLALLAGLIIGVPTVLTGVADWLTISRGTPLWRTATTHALVNAVATALFLLTVVVGHGDYVNGDVTALPFVLTLLAFSTLAIGGWLGGTIVFVHGMRVLNLVEEPAAKAASPAPQPEHEAAARD